MRLLFHIILWGGTLFFASTIMPSAYAATALSYHDFQHSAATKLLHRHLRSHHQGAFSPSAVVAQSDLNDDGLDEFIVRHCADDDTRLCTHTIWAEISRNYLEVARISTLRLAVGTAKKNGVRNIISYSDPINDYNATVYVWDAANSRYIKE